MKQKILKIKEIVEKELSCSAHDLEHVMRVYRLCMQLAECEKDVDMDVLKAAILLHDIARVREDMDKTGKTDHAILGAKMAAQILKKLGYEKGFIEKVKHCILTHRFRGKNKPKTKEAKLLFDADKLDVLGAIGIARAFIIAGRYNERIYADVDIKEYAKHNLVGGKINGRVKDISKHAPNIEFETKFKYIPESLYTEKAKSIARERMRFMNEFFSRLKKEINGEL